MKKALILPFFLSKPKDIERYRKIYLDMDFEKVDFVKYKIRNVLTEKSLMKKVNSLHDLEDYYDVVHCISGGFFILVGLLKSKKCEFGKIVCESAPCIPDGKTFISLLKLPKISYYCSFIIIDKLDIYKKTIKNSISTLSSHKNKIIMLLGTDDNLIQIEKIRKYFEGFNNVEYVIFKGGKHLTLKKSDPELYVKSLNFRN